MRFPRLTVRFLLVVFSFFLIVSLVATASFFFELNSIVGRLGRAYAIERAQSAHASIANLLEREATLASKFADSPVVKRWILDEQDKAFRKVAFQEMESYRRAFLDSNYFVVVGASHHYYNQPTTGPLVMTTLHTAAPSDQWYFNEVAAGEPMTFNLDYNTLIGAAKVWINCLVRSNGRVIGMAGTGIDITDLVKHLVQADGSGATSMLIDEQGVITAHPNASYLEYNAMANDENNRKITVFDLAASRVDRNRLEALIARAKKGETAVGLVNLQGHTSLTAVSPISEIGWLMIVSVDTSSMISMNDFVPLFVVLVVSLLVALLVIALLMDRMVLRPLGAMTRSANRMAGGNYNLVLPIDRKDEIGTLSSAFNDMAAKVKGYTENLEALVKSRTSELSDANERLAAANREVMESMRYARLIQDGLMPPASVLAERFSSYSFFHRQRDIVGGDFLFLRDFREGQRAFLIAVIDCEGHGVPGALMTMMADSSLQLIASGGSARDPAAILTALDSAVRSSLRQEDESAQVQGGMEIGMCACFPSEKLLVYAGAGMPLYVRDPGGSVRTVSGRKRAIGYPAHRRIERFENRRVASDGRAFYLLTDGFVDQSGGSAGRGYGTRRLFERLATCGGQGGEVFSDWENEFDTYRESRAQRDDVLAIGFTL